MVRLGQTRYRQCAAGVREESAVSQPRPHDPALEKGRAVWAPD